MKDILLSFYFFIFTKYQGEKSNKFILIGQGLQYHLKMSSIHLLEQLIDCRQLPQLVPDSDIRNQLLVKTPEPEFVRNIKSNPLYYQHKHTNAPYLLQSNTPMQINNITKDSFVDPFSISQKRQPIPSSQERISIQDSAILPKSKRTEPMIRKDPIEMDFLNPNTFATTLFDSTIVHVKSAQPSPMKANHSVDKLLLREPPKNTSRRLTPSQAQSYHHKLHELNLKINQISLINEGLQSKIQQASELIDGKTDENKRLMKKISDLGQKIKQQNHQTQSLQVQSQREKFQLQNYLIQLKNKCSLNINQLQNELYQQKGIIQIQDQKRVHLQRSIQNKKKQLSRLKQFSYQIQKGIADMKISQF